MKTCTELIILKSSIWINLLKYGKWKILEKLLSRFNLIWTVLKMHSLWRKTFFNLIETSCSSYIIAYKCGAVRYYLNSIYKRIPKTITCTCSTHELFSSLIIHTREIFTLSPFETVLIHQILIFFFFNPLYFFYI